MNVMLSKTFFPQHPKAGEPTGFAEKVKNGTKRHTCRCNYEYWKDRIARLQERGGVLSIRQWSGKPYQKGSSTELIMDVPASMIEVQQLVMVRRSADGYVYSALVDGKPVDIVALAKNDGLTLDDFKAWFNHVFDNYEKQVEIQKDGEVIRPTETALKFAVIHFTTFRY
jgi:hypothetical protein